MRYGFVEDPEYEGEDQRFLLHFDGEPNGAFHGSRGDVEEYVEKRNREAEEIQQALWSNDPRALCSLGWHRQTVDGGRPLFFRLLPRLWGALFGFAMGPAPFDETCTRLATFGRGEPWVCEACEEEIGA